jgi:WD40 repeat protein
VALSPDGTIVASAGVERMVQLWYVKSGKMFRTLPHDDELTVVAFSPDGTMLTSGVHDHQNYLWVLRH